MREHIVPILLAVVGVPILVGLACILALFFYHDIDRPQVATEVTAPTRVSELPEGYWLERDTVTGLYRQCHVLMLNEPMCGKKFSKETAIQQANNWHEIDVQERIGREGKWEKVTP